MLWNPFRRSDRHRSEREQIRDLEDKAARVAPAYRAQYLSRAGDLSASARDMDRALDLWGRAIDSYLENARPEAAAAACRKVIQRVPDVVRARRTLALLTIGQGHVEEALAQVRRYVEAAQHAGHTELAVKQLRIMVRAAPEESVRAGIVDILSDLDPHQSGTPGRQVLSLGDAARAETDHDRWSIILEAAMMSPEQVARL